MIKTLSFVTRALAISAIASLATGCTGEIRESTSARTATEQLLISSAAERAVKKFREAGPLVRGKRIAIDDSRFNSIDKPYVMSALRNYLSGKGATLIAKGGENIKNAKGKEVKVTPELVVEIRSATLGIKDASMGFGLPPLPLPVPNSNLTTKTPGLYFIFRDKQEGWAKFQFWLYEPSKRRYLVQSKDLWGHSYYSLWTFIGVGPFDFSNDVYPDDEELDEVAD